MNIVKIFSNGDVARLVIDGDLGELQDLIGGYIEEVRRGPRGLVELRGTTVYVNEEGLPHDPPLPRNLLAEWACDRVGLVGPAIVMQHKGLPLKRANEIMAALRRRQATIGVRVRPR